MAESENSALETQPSLGKTPSWAALASFFQLLPLQSSSKQRGAFFLKTETDV